MANFFDYVAAEEGIPCYRYENVEAKLTGEELKNGWTLGAPGLRQLSAEMLT